MAFATVLARQQTPQQQPPQKPASQETAPQKSAPPISPNEATSATVDNQVGINKRPTPWLAHLMRRSPSNLRLNELTFPAAAAPVFLTPQDRVLRPTIEINGIYLRPGWTLAAQGHELQGPNEASGFSFWVYLNGKINEITFTSIGPNQEIEEETVYIYSNEAQELRLTSAWNGITISPHLTSINYTQTGYSTYSAIAGALQGSYSTFDTPSNWTVYGEGTFTALPLTASSASHNPQFIEARGDVAYNTKWRLRKLKNVKIQALLGVSYMSMLTDAGSFGFTNLASPELGIRARYVLDANRALTFDLRFIPLGGTNYIGDNGVSTRVVYSRTLMNGHRTDLGMSFVNYTYHPDRANAVNLRMISVLLGYTF